MLHGAAYETHAKTEPEIDKVVCMFAHAGFAVEDALKKLSDWPDEALINRPWQDSDLSIDPPLWLSVWWDTDMVRLASKMGAANTTVQNWYCSDGLKNRLDCYLESAPSDTKTWARAADVDIVLRKMRAAQ